MRALGASAIVGGPAFPITSEEAVHGAAVIESAVRAAAEEQMSPELRRA